MLKLKNLPDGACLPACTGAGAAKTDAWLTQRLREKAADLARHDLYACNLQRGVVLPGRVQPGQRERPQAVGGRGNPHRQDAPQLGAGPRQAQRVPARRRSKIHRGKATAVMASGPHHPASRTRGQRGDALCVLQGFSPLEGRATLQAHLRRPQAHRFYRFLSCCRGRGWSLTLRLVFIRSPGLSRKLPWKPRADASAGRR